MKRVRNPAAGCCCQSPHEETKSMNRLSSVMLLMSVLLSSCGGLQRHTLQSPDQRIALDFFLRDGLPHYDLVYQEKKLIYPSALGLIFRGSGFPGKDLKIQEIRRVSADRGWTPARGYSQSIRTAWNQMQVRLQEKSSPHRRYSLEFRAYNDGIAFRYAVPNQGSHIDNLIYDEKTTVRFNQNFRCFYLNSRAAVRESEQFYQQMTLRNINEFDTVDLPLFVESGVIWMMIAEVAQSEQMNLTMTGLRGAPTVLETRLTSVSDSGYVNPGVQTPYTSSWRVIMMNEKPDELVQSSLVRNLLNENPPRDTTRIRHGEALWPWLVDLKVPDLNIDSVQGLSLHKIYENLVTRYALFYLRLIGIAL